MSVAWVARCAASCARLCHQDVPPNGGFTGAVEKTSTAPTTWRYLAETKGFEPLMQLNTAYSLSRGAPSASRSRLQPEICEECDSNRELPYFWKSQAAS